MVSASAAPTSRKRRDRAAGQRTAREQPDRIDEAKTLREEQDAGQRDNEESER